MYYVTAFYNLFLDENNNRRSPLLSESFVEATEDEVLELVCNGERIPITRTDLKSGKRTICN